MDTDQFEECKGRHRYEDFMGSTLRLNNLKMDDYQKFMPRIFDIVAKNTKKDPFVMYEDVIDELRKSWNASPSLPFHGPWHHGLVGGMIIAALRNNGHGFNDEDVTEALKRGLMIPGGGCGFLGICGAATGIGIAFSIIERSTLFHDGERRVALYMCSKAMRMISKLGGPRCYDHELNPQCHKERCPYYPRLKTSV